MRMNISVPDALAEEVRRRDIAISAVCQRALRDEVNRLRATEAGDILVYVKSEQADPDPTTWPGFDPAKPILTYKHWQVPVIEGSPPGEWVLGWVLDYEPGDRPSDDGQAYHAGDPGAPPVEWARQVLRETSGRREHDRGMKKITVKVGNPPLTVGFTGRWLVDPDSDEALTDESGCDAEAYWGIALTRRGRIAVFTAHRNNDWPASLQSYDSLDEATARVPPDIIARSVGELGETRVLWRDI